MWFGIITLFPEMFTAIEVGITGRAIKNQLITLKHFNPRDFTTDKHQSVDDHPYGGGPGMVMMAEPLKKALDAAKAAAPCPPHVIYLSPQGQLFQQAAAESLLAHQAIILLAGRYEGIDERIIASEIDAEWSIGDYILTGGELAAMVMIDTMTRLIPGAIGDQDSVRQDSLTTGLLKYPQYTRPENFAGMAVPDILVSGDHQRIADWRLGQSLGKTAQKRPDLLAKKSLSQQELALLDDFLKKSD